MTRQQIPKENRSVTRRQRVMSGTGQRPRLDQRLTTANVKRIVHRLDVSVNNVVTAAVDLASIANTTKMAGWARLATDAYEICTQVHTLMDDVLLEWGESEVAI